MKWHDTLIYTPCDLMVGKNMCKELMKELKSVEIPQDELKLATKLQNIYEELNA